MVDRSLIEEGMNPRGIRPCLVGQGGGPTATAAAAAVGIPCNAMQLRGSWIMLEIGRARLFTAAVWLIDRPAWPAEEGTGTVNAAARAALGVGVEAFRQRRGQGSLEAQAGREREEDHHTVFFLGKDHDGLGRPWKE